MNSLRARPLWSWRLMGMARLLVGAHLVAIVTFASAKFIPKEVEQVPVARLIQNLERELEPHPEDSQWNYLLARVHAIAFSQASGKVSVVKTNQLPYFGPTDHGWPVQGVREPICGPYSAGQHAHLTNAIARYQRAVQVQADHLPAQLGLGWCLAQASRTNEARQVYRAALRLAWAKEEKQHGLYEGASVTEEIVGYLLPLLNPVDDAEEIQRIRSYADDMRKKPRYITPVLIPLEDELDWNDLVDPEARVRFDLDGSGFPNDWPWLTPRAGWLVYDPNGQGQITSGLQLFGSVTFWVFWRNGYEAMASLDDNGDGELSGPELAGMALWHDVNRDGRSDPGEVRPLSSYGVEALACVGAVPFQGGYRHAQGLRMTTGHVRPTYDWICPAQVSPR